MTDAELRAWRESRPPKRAGDRGPTPAGWSRAVLAAWLGVSVNAVAHWETGRRPVPKWVATRLTADRRKRKS